MGLLSLYLVVVGLATAGANANTVCVTADRPDAHQLVLQLAIEQAASSVVGQAMVVGRETLIGNEQSAELDGWSTSISAPYVLPDEDKIRVWTIMDAGAERLCAEVITEIEPYPENQGTTDDSQQQNHSTQTALETTR